MEWKPHAIFVSISISLTFEKQAVVQLVFSIYEHAAGDMGALRKTNKYVWLHIRHFSQVITVREITYKLHNLSFILLTSTSTSKYQVCSSHDQIQKNEAKSDEIDML